MGKKKRNGPKARNTMDVDPSWLEAEPEPPPPPPRLPQDLASQSAAPGPRRRETMEVQMDWLEPPEQETEPGAGEKKKRDSKRPKKPVIPPLLVAKPRGKLPPPLPRSEPPASSRSSRRPGRGDR